MLSATQWNMLNLLRDNERHANALAAGYIYLVGDEDLIVPRQEAMERLANLGLASFSDEDGYAITDRGYAVSLRAHFTRRKGQSTKCRTSYHFQTS